jgi:putative chitinase
MDAPELAQVMNIPLARAQKWADALTAAMAGGQINTRLRIAAFLAQIGHESGSLVYTKELGGPSYFAKYDGRKDLGNTEPGDGAKFCGRGLIQVTGRDNYAKVSASLFGDYRLLRTPELLEQPEWAAKSAVWYWSTRNLNLLADGTQFTDITKKINGGLNGIDDRKARYVLALSVLK